MSPRVSVLVTSYQTPLIGPALASVSIQSFKDWECIVMDDGSTDPETIKQLDAWAWWSKDKPFRFHYFDPSLEERAATARYATLLNRAAELAAGEYLTFLCSDDYYVRDRLERMVAKLDAGASVVYGRQQLVDRDGFTFGYHVGGERLTDAFHKVDLNSVMLRRSVFDEVGGFPDDASLWRDADAHLWRKLTDAGYVFEPIEGLPSDVKRYRADGVDERVKAGLTPWA